MQHPGRFSAAPKYSFHRRVGHQPVQVFGGRNGTGSFQLNRDTPAFLMHQYTVLAAFASSTDPDRTYALLVLSGPDPTYALLVLSAPEPFLQTVRLHGRARTATAFATISAFGLW